MTLSIHIDFDGRCRQAFEFYAALMHGRIGTMLTFGKSPMASEVPEDWQDKILHGNINIQQVEIAGFDSQAHQYAKPRGFTLLYGTTSIEESEHVFNALAKDGEVLLPLQETFWSPCYGIVTDRFHVPWKIICRQPGQASQET